MTGRVAGLSLKKVLSSLRKQLLTNVDDRNCSEYLEYRFNLNVHAFSFLFFHMHD